MVDPNENRLVLARQLRATDTTAQEPIDAIQSLAGGVEPAALVSYRFALDDIEHACDMFSQAAREQSVKLLLSAG